MDNQKHTHAKQRHDALIAAAKVETRPLADWCGELGYTYEYAHAILLRYSVPFKGRREAKQEKMLELCAKGLDCMQIANELGMASAWHVHKRLTYLGAKPMKLVGQHRVYEIGNRHLSRDVPRPIKMIGDLKRGMKTRDMQEKYGVSRERISQVRAFGVQEGLLEVAHE
jgi:hypothetical protein